MIQLCLEEIQIVHHYLEKHYHQLRLQYRCYYLMSPFLEYASIRTQSIRLLKLTRAFMYS